MWIKLDNSELWVKRIAKWPVYKNQTIGALTCTTGPCSVVPFVRHVMIGSAVSFSRTTSYFTIAYDEPVAVDDEYALLKVIDRIDTETTLENLED